MGSIWKHFWITFKNTAKRRESEISGLIRENKGQRKPCSPIFYGVLVSLAEIHVINYSKFYSLTSEQYLGACQTKIVNG